MCKEKKFKVFIAIIFEIQNELNSNLIAVNKRFIFHSFITSVVFIYYISDKFDQKQIWNLGSCKRGHSKY